MKLEIPISKKVGYAPIIYAQQNKIFIIQKTTNKCNNRCLFCVLPDCFSFLGRKISPPDSGQFKKIINSYENEIFKELRVRRKPDYISLTTAEPTVREDLKEIINYLSEKFPQAYISLLTNGRKFVNLKYVLTLKDELARVGLEIPLHGHTAELHDLLTRELGSFQQTVDGLKNIYHVLPEARVNIRILINKINVASLDNIINWVLNQFPKVQSIILIYISMVGLAKENDKELFVGLSETSEYLNIVLEKYNSKIKVYNFPFCHIHEKFWNLNAGRTLVPDEIEFGKKCKLCVKKNNCPGFWKSKLNEKLFDEVRPILTSHNFYDINEGLHTNKGTTF